MAANTARDVGARLMAVSIWGRKAGGGPYAAIAALTNIPATILAAVFYEVFLCDTSRGGCIRASRGGVVVLIWDL